ncbi:hypothetical protein AKO1_010033 [Acrasis kona]|uniref:Uncharacterized protein n=1 Tax=Acrasis kona TaxID=1008807 RepID=A0AAW2YY78_9EUKA
MYASIETEPQIWSLDKLSNHTRDLFLEYDQKSKGPDDVKQQKKIEFIRSSLDPRVDLFIKNNSEGDLYDILMYSALTTLFAYLMKVVIKPFSKTLSTFLHAIIVISMSAAAMSLLTHSKLLGGSVPIKFHHLQSSFNWLKTTIPQSRALLDSIWKVLEIPYVPTALVALFVVVLSIYCWIRYDQSNYTVDQSGFVSPGHVHQYHSPNHMPPLNQSIRMTPKRGNIFATPNPKDTKKLFSPSMQNQNMFSPMRGQNTMFSPARQNNEGVYNTSQLNISNIGQVEDEDQNENNITQEDIVNLFNIIKSIKTPGKGTPVRTPAAQTPVGRTPSAKTPQVSRAPTSQTPVSNRTPSVKTPQWRPGQANYNHASKHFDQEPHTPDQSTTPYARPPLHSSSKKKVRMAVCEEDLRDWRTPLSIVPTVSSGRNQVSDDPLEWLDD